MNILPKKSWHVRNKNNIERVRRDEQKAAEEEKERQKRIAIAESEARTELLRQKSRQHHNSDLTLPASSSSQRHINFFEDLEQGTKLGGKNVEHEEEKRLEKEKQEKAIGLLTYLGQGSVELGANKPWYFKAPEKRKCDDDSSFASKQKDEVDAKKKRASDPVCMMNTYVDQTVKVHRLKHGCTSEASRQRKNEAARRTATKSIEELRAERIRREQRERQRAEQLLQPRTQGGGDERLVDDRQRRYNSQFNPDIARRPRPRDSFT